jgi:glycogen(starch) synthase
MSHPELLNRPLLIEIAWEVCNQIGGIYTVVKTKAPSMVSRWGENYFLVGPHTEHGSALEFESSPAPQEIEDAAASLRERGIVLHCGKWLIPGRPSVILVDFSGVKHRCNEEKYLLWKDNGIDLSDGDSGVNDSVTFGFAVAELLKELASRTSPRKIIAHFHEWMAGIALPRLHHERIPVTTVFTTHATLLGRYVASGDTNFYSNLPLIDAAQAARHYNIASRHSIEGACTQAAHIFTTVSEVTAREAKYFLGREADFVLPNGLNAHRFAALHEFQNLHLKYKEKIHEFVMGHFFPSYSFDLDRTLYIFTSGRYEYRNKGMDLFIEALYRLNTRLKSLSKPPTVIAFIITRAQTKNVSVGTLQNHLLFEDLKSACKEIELGLGPRILSAAARGRMPSYEELLTDDMQVRLKRAMLSRKSSVWPPIVTHDLCDDGNDQVLSHLRHRNLVNAPSDPVKVIFHPDFVSITSLFNLDYEQFVRGCHMGVFPSYYEPWGYTPLECLALGLPTVTTDLSGFGAYAQRTISDALSNGVLVLERSKQSPDDSIQQLADFLVKFCELSRRERIGLRNRAERLTERFTWDTLAAHYQRAHAEALRVVAPG